MFERSLVPLKRREFSSQLERVFDEVLNFGMDELGGVFHNSSLSKTLFPKVDVKELPDKYVIDATIPGMKKEDVNIEIQEIGDQAHIILSGRTQTQSGTTQPDYIRKEIHRSSFTRAWILPDDVDLKKDITASAKDGILTIEIARVPVTPVKSTKVEIK